MELNGSHRREDVVATCKYDGDGRGCKVEGTAVASGGLSSKRRPRLPLGQLRSVRSSSFETQMINCPSLHVQDGRCKGDEKLLG